MSTLILNNPARLAILGQIAQQRERQAGKFPHEEIELDLFVGLAVLGEEKGECDRAALEAREALLAGRYAPSIHDNALRAELLDVAATAVKLVELLDRNALVFGVSTDEPDPAAAESAPWCGLCHTAMRKDAQDHYVCEHCGAREEDEQVTGNAS